VLRLAWRLERARGVVQLPTGSLLGGLLFHGRSLFTSFRTMLMQTLVYEPGLRYRCRSLGHKLRLMGPAPRIMGDGIIDIGDDVMFGEGMSFVVGIGLPEPAHLEIKSHVTFFGHQLICVARRVSIGNYCWIGGTIYDNDMHPLDPAQRRLAWAVDHGTIASAPVVIEDDVWVGLSAIILKGVTVHRGAVVGAGAVVTQSVPPLCVVAGNPARVVKQLSQDTTADERLAAIRSS
jgi:acetyltransferase-like isoleucine patch superfamily enzyme